MPGDVRRLALEHELGFWLGTAAQDLSYAEDYARLAPQSGEPVEAYLDRWIELGDGGHVLAGPRYWGRDPNLPFVGVSASDRPLLPSDRQSLRIIARDHFGAFQPGFVLVWTSDPIGTWPDTAPEMRQLVGLLGDLRRHETPPELICTPRADTAFYGRYRQIHDAHVAQDPDHARHARCEDEADLQELADQGLLYDVHIHDTWAGILAAEPEDRHGIKGTTVIELLLDHPYRGRGYGKHLSTLLAKVLPMPDQTCLMGTIHADNVTAYRSALRVGRIDVGGEIRIPL
jgi:GNAT superfamily N-acetyltransferase